MDKPFDIADKDSTIKNSHPDGEKPASYEIQIIGDKNKMNIVVALGKAEIFYKIAVRDKKFFIQFATPDDLESAKEIANKVIDDGEGLKDQKTNDEEAADDPIEADLPIEEPSKVKEMKSPFEVARLEGVIADQKRIASEAMKRSEKATDQKSKDIWNECARRAGSDVKIAQAALDRLLGKDKK